MPLGIVEMEVHPLGVPSQLLSWLLSTQDTLFIRISRGDKATQLPAIENPFENTTIPYPTGMGKIKADIW